MLFLISHSICFKETILLDIVTSSTLMPEVKRKGHVYTYMSQTIILRLAENVTADIKDFKSSVRTENIVGYKPL